MGTIEVCRNETGFLTSVDFSTGKTEQNPSITAHHKLVSGDFDAALIVGDDFLFSSSGLVAQALAKIPIVYIGPQRNNTSQKATISLLTVENGIFTDGSMNRMDQMEIALMPIDDISLTLPTELDLVAKLHQTVKSKS
jgi:formylmethanofuran dehydrogenase subunit B